MESIYGGCHCGNIRYKVDVAPFDSDYCHCKDCHKITGSPISAWVDFKSSEVTWLTGTPKLYRSSEFIYRGFCECCGSTLTYQSSENSDVITLSTGSLDNPSAYAPNYHIFTKNRVEWLNIVDTKPKYLGHRTKN